MAYEGWAIVELFGHKQHAGRVSEVQQFGVTMLRIDVPKAHLGEGDATDAVLATHFYGGSSIYGLHPCTEEAARKMCAHGQPKPLALLTVAEAAPLPCRKCSECDGHHHWIEGQVDYDPTPGALPADHSCKHCDAVGDTCQMCGDLEPEPDCEECAGRGIVVIGKRKVGASEPEGW